MRGLRRMGCREGEEVVVEDMIVFVFWQVDQALRQGFFCFSFFMPSRAMPGNARDGKKKRI